MSLDQQLFLYMYGFTHHSVVLDNVALFWGSYSPHVWAILLIIAFYIPHRRQVMNRTMLLVGLVAGFAARYIGKSAILLFYAHPRPFIALDIQPLITTPFSENYQSFPSGHALFFFAFATVLYYFHKRSGVVAFGASVLMGISRIYLGVHWPSDIVAGAALGILSGMAVLAYYKRYALHVDQFITNGFRTRHE